MRRLCAGWESGYPVAPEVSEYLRPVVPQGTLVVEGGCSAVPEGTPIFGKSTPKRTGRYPGIFKSLPGKRTGRYPCIFRVVTRECSRIPEYFASQFKKVSGGTLVFASLRTEASGGTLVP